MKILELIRYSEKLLTGKRTHILAVCLLPIAARLIFRLTETAVYCLILYFTDTEPFSLFSGSSGILLSVILILTITGKLLAAPLKYAAAVRLTELCAENRTSFTPLWSVISGKKSFRRSMGAMFITSIIELALAVLVMIPLFLAYDFLVSGKAFNIIHSLSFTLAFLVIYVSVKLDFLAVPFLLANYRDKSVISIVLLSLRFLRGRKFHILRLMFMYAFSFVLIVPFPYFYPEFMTAFSLCISIFLREDEYLERNKIHSRKHRTGNSGKIPYGTEGRFKAAADQT